MTQLTFNFRTTLFTDIFEGNWKNMIPKSAHLQFFSLLCRDITIINIFYVVYITNGL